MRDSRSIQKNKVDSTKKRFSFSRKIPYPEDFELNYSEILITLINMEDLFRKGFDSLLECEIMEEKFIIYSIQLY